MAGKLKDEIGKTGPFASLEEEATLNLLRTADRVTGFFEEFLKTKGLTPTQYNVLRILRGVSPKGVSCQLIAKWMITRDADLTRLLDRLEARELTRRERQTDDRRVVHIFITDSGLQLLQELDPAIVEMNQLLLGKVDKQRLMSFIELMEHVRNQLELAKDPLTI